MTELKKLTREDYPKLLTPLDIQQILRIGRKNTYELLNMVEAKNYRKRNPEFHVFRVGKLFRIPRDSFFDWIEGQK